MQLLLVRAPHLNSAYFWVPPSYTHETLGNFPQYYIIGVGGDMQAYLLPFRHLNQLTVFFTKLTTGVVPS